MLISSITNCISTFASKLSILSVIFPDSEFHFKNLLALLRFVKIREFCEFLRIIQFALSVYGVFVTITYGAEYCDKVHVRNVLLDFLPVANDMLELEMADVFRPAALRVVDASRLKFHRRRVHLNTKYTRCHDRSYALRHEEEIASSL